MNNQILEHVSHFLPMIAVASAVYFLLIRPQKKKAEDHTNLLSHLKHNDYVMTTGGLWGHVEKVTDTKVSLQIHKGVVVEVEKTSIVAVQSSYEKKSDHASPEHTTKKAKKKPEEKQKRVPGKKVS